MHTSCSLRIDGQDLPCRAATCRRGMAWPVGQLRCDIPAGVDAPAIGSSCTLHAQVGETERLIFTGIVQRSEQGRAGGAILACEPAVTLTRIFIDRSWQNTTAGSIISELAGEGDVSLAPGLPPTTLLPSYVVLREAHLLDQIHRLAHLAGHACYSLADGSLTIDPALPVPGPTLLDETQAFTAFEHARLETPPPPTIHGSGAMGSAGPGADSWFLADNGAMAGGGDGMQVQAAALKSVADVQLMAEAEGMRLRERGSVIDCRIVTLPEVDLGSVVTLLPEGPARVVALDLRYAADSGLGLGLRLQGLL